MIKNILSLLISSIFMVGYGFAASPTYGPENIPNPGFEALGGYLYSSWIKNGNVVDDTEIFHDGAHAARFTSASGNSWYASQLLQTFTVIPNTNYILTFWARGDGVHAGGYGVYDATHKVYIVAGATSTGVTVTTWTQVTVPFQTPAECVSVTLFLGDSGIAAGTQSWWFDDISIKAVTSVPLPESHMPGNVSSSSAPVTVSTVAASAETKTSAPEASNKPASLCFTPRVILPPEITAVVGDNLQVFTRGVIEAQDPYSLPYNIISNAGAGSASYPRFFDYTPPVGSAGTKTLTFSVFDLQKQLLASATTKLVVVNATGQPSANKNVLCIGDSLTGNGIWPQEMYRRLTQIEGSPAGKGYGNITFLGDVPMGSYPTQGFVAWGGWTNAGHMGTSGTKGGYILTGTFDKDRTDMNSIYAYGTSTYRIMETMGRLKVSLCSGSDIPLVGGGSFAWVSGGSHHSAIAYTSYAEEPSYSVFWDAGKGRASFTDWFARVGGTGTLDIVYILLGWNELGTGPSAADHAAAILASKGLIDRIHADYPKCLVRIMGVQIPSYNGGLGTNYGSEGSRTDYYNCVRNANGYNLAMESLAADPAYSTFVRYLGIASQFDGEWNNIHASFPVNNRNPITEDRQTNGFHPATPGYYQIADVAYRDFIRTFCAP